MGEETFIHEGEVEESWKGGKRGRGEMMQDEREEFGGKWGEVVLWFTRSGGGSDSESES